MTLPCVCLLLAPVCAQGMDAQTNHEHLPFAYRRAAVDLLVMTIVPMLPWKGPKTFNQCVLLTCGRRVAGLLQLAGDLFARQSALPEVTCRAAAVETPFRSPVRSCYASCTSLCDTLLQLSTRHLEHKTHRRRSVQKFTLCHDLAE